MGERVVWDAAQYERFAAERERPFHDLLARVPDGDVRHAADLGCGTGRLTRTLLARWPAATIHGIDNSTEMLARAADEGADPRLRFIEHDLADWEPPHPLDRIVSNAALHWIPDHAILLARLTARLAPGGVLAVQMPSNRGEMPHRAARGTDRRAALAWARAGARPGAGRGAGIVLRGDSVRLRVAGRPVGDHLLPPAPARSNAIVDWLEGATLRPILSGLDAEGAKELRDALLARLAPVYRPGSAAIVFPFRRLFFVARRA